MQIPFPSPPKLESLETHAHFCECCMARLSHDLRSPIGVVLLSAQMVQSVARSLPEGKSRADLLRLGERIVKSMRQSDRIIHNFMDTVLLELGERPTVQIGPCELGELVRKARDELEGRLHARVRIQGGPARGFWDREGLERSLTNLLVHAARCAPDESPITVDFFPQGTRVRLSVHYPGRPLTGAECSALLAPQPTIQDSCGTGLPLLRALCEAMGGTLSLESSAEAGTTFTVELPRDARPYQQPA